MSGVDVLAVMKRDAGDAHEGRCQKFKAAHAMKLSEESEQARAAVAELIESDREYDAAHAAYAQARTGAPRNAAWERVVAAKARRHAAIGTCLPGGNVAVASVGAAP